MTARLVDDDPYVVLGLPHTASESDVRAARRRLLRRFHPDVPGGDLRLAQSVSAAAALLLDPARRAAFDRSLIQVRPAPARPAPATHRSTPAPDRPPAYGPAPATRGPAGTAPAPRVSRSTRHRAADRQHHFRTHPAGPRRRTASRRRVTIHENHVGALGVLAVIAAALAGPVGIALGLVVGRQPDGRQLARIAVAVGTAWILFVACSGGLVALSY